MQPNFKVFRRRAKRSEGPAITIQKRGNATINEAAWNALGKPASVNLLFDEEQYILGLQAAEPNSPDSYRVRPVNRNQTTRTFSMQALLNYYGVALDRSRRYTLELLEGNVLAVNLRSGSEDASSAKARRNK